MSLIPSKIEPQATAESTFVGQVTAGRTIAGVANNLTHLSGFRGMRFLHQMCDFQGVANDVPPTGPMAVAPRMRWTIGPMAQYLWFGGFIAAELEEPGGTQIPVLRVHIETPDGVVLDTPIEFTEANGALISNKFKPNVGDGQRGATMARDALVHTGWSVAALGVAPRLLNLGFNQGTNAVIRLETDHCRVYSLMALEIYSDRPAMPSLVVNEIDYDMPGADLDEFFEIYNAGTADQDLTNAVAKYYDGFGAVVTTHVLNIGDGIMKPGDRFVVGTASVVAGLPVGTKSITMPSSSLNNVAGGITIEVDGYWVNGVSWETPWGTIPGVTEGTELSPDASSANSWQRFPDGKNTHNNSNDFHLALPQPGLPNI